MSEKFTCPRREAEGATSERFTFGGRNKDTWDENHECSYDGSLHPDKFMAYVRAGKKVGTTDKSYKFYLDEYDEPHRGAAKFYTHHLSEEQSEEFVRLRLQGKINFGMFPPYVPLYLPGMTNEKAQQIRQELEK